MPELIVETTNGKLRGLTANGACVFRGIRYGASTGGANRFLPPQPVQKWSGTREADTWGPSAAQVEDPQGKDPFYGWYAEIQPISEDCLSLNVFTPAIGRTKKRPVMVWIHGGGWRVFSGSAPGFDGSRLAQMQDVVVITLNHRLTAFGYLLLDDQSEDFADAANAGLLDIVAALQWVRDNAEAFGGDPENVTIFGQSGGGSKIAALLAMQAAKGLFHKAIVQSSSGGMFLNTRETATRHAYELANALGLKKPTGSELQKLPMEAIVTALQSLAGPFVGVVDDRQFKVNPYSPSGPMISAHIPVLAGCTNTEATYYLRKDPRNFDLPRENVLGRLMRFLIIDRARAEQILAGYAKTYPAANESGLLVMITSDYLFKRNTRKIAALHADLNGAKVYHYLFDRNTAVEGGRLMSPHTTEVPFIFGTAQAARAHIGDGPDITPMTQIMMTTWASFARSGNPNNETLPEWKPFSENNPHTMVLDVESHLENDPGESARSLLDDLAYYGYNHPRVSFVTD